MAISGQVSIWRWVFFKIPANIKENQHYLSIRRCFSRILYDFSISPSPKGRKWRSNIRFEVFFLFHSSWLYYFDGQTGAIGVSRGAVSEFEVMLWFCVRAKSENGNWKWGSKFFFYSSRLCYVFLHSQSRTTSVSACACSFGIRRDFCIIFSLTQEL